MERSYSPAGFRPPDTRPLLSGASSSSLGGGSAHGGGSTHSGAAMNPSEVMIQFSVDEEVREREENGWEYSSYTVVTTYQGQPFTVQRRYKEFKMLHNQLRPHAPSLAPNFPLWGNLFNRFAPGVIEERKVGFQKYLTEALLALPQSAPIPHVLRTFLNLPPPDAVDNRNEQASLMVPSQLEPTDTVILAAYQLPLTVSRSSTSPSGFSVVWDDNSVLNRLALNLPTRVLWVGCVSLKVEKEEEEALAELLLEEYDCVAVFLDEELITSFYHGFCRGYLRPILHNQLVVPTEKDPYSEDEWRAYW